MERVARSRAAMALVLAIACTGCVGLLVLRSVFVGHFQLKFLIWNLFLAMVAFPAAWLVDAMSRRGTKFRWMVIPAAFWLAFFPNASYLLTDIIHLTPTRQIALWFDGLLYFAFASTGLLLAFSSLYLVQAVVVRRFGPRRGWLLALVAIGFGSYGIYLGRFERWNSWDVVTHPRSIAHRLRIQVTDPLSNRQALVFTLVFAIFQCTVYVTIRAFAHLVTVDFKDGETIRA